MSVMLIAFGCISALVCLLTLADKTIRKRGAIGLVFSTGAIVLGFSTIDTNGSKIAEATTIESSRAPAAVLPAAEPSSPSAASPIGPGRAKICLTGEDVRLKPGDILTIPASTVFEDQGPNAGKRDEPDTWGHETQAGENYHSAFVTTDAVDLKGTAKCGEAGVRMYLDPLRTTTSARVADAHLFRIENVLEYPVPSKRPPIEVGKLIDDIDVTAVLIEDAGQPLTAPEPPPESDRPAMCLAGAKKLAAFIGAGVGSQGAINVRLGGVAAHEASYTCSSFVSKDSPGLFVAWDGSAKPPANTKALIAKAGEFLTGATKPEILSELSACVAQALKPEASELSSREFRGVKIECSAFARDGGGGTVDIYRRFGAPPVRSDPSGEAVSKLEATSKAYADQEERKAEGSRQFAEWFQDATIPKEVKVFAMMAARIIALGERCPSAKPHDQKVNEWASSAGVSLADVQPGGRYSSLMAMMMTSMRKDVAKTPVKEACQSAARYD